MQIILLAVSSPGRGANIETAMNHKVISFLIAAVYFVFLAFFVIGTWPGGEPDPTPLGTKLLGWAFVIGLGYGVMKYYEWARGAYVRKELVGAPSELYVPAAAPASPVTAPPPVPAPPPAELQLTTAERLRRVDRLFEEGVISSEERETKRRDIMKDL